MAPRRRAVLAAALVAALAPALAGAQPPPSLVARTPVLYLAGDGSLTPESGSPPDQPCLAIGPTGGGPTQASFTARLRDGPYHIVSQTVAVSLALSGAGGAAKAGTGFTLRGSLAFGNTTAYEASQRFEAGATPSAASLAFAVLERHAVVEGPMNLHLSLEALSGGLPAAAGQDVQVLCNSGGSRVEPFDYAAGAPGALDIDADGVPDEEQALHPPPGTGPRATLPGVLSFALLASTATFAGGLVVLAGRKVSERRLHFLLGLTAGLLLTIAIVDLIPEAVELNPASAWTVALGVLGLYAIRWVSGEHGHGEPRHDTEGLHEEHGPHGGGPHVARLVWVTFAALAIHTFIDGVVLPAAFQLDTATGLTVVGAIFAHLFPDGMAGATIFLAAMWTRRRAFQGLTAIALFTPLGAMAGLLLLGLDGVIGHLVGLAAATFIFIALSELIPELQQSRHRAVVGTGFVAGYGLAFLVEVIARFIA